MAMAPFQVASNDARPRERHGTQHGRNARSARGGLRSNHEANLARSRDGQIPRIAYSVLAILFGTAPKGTATGREPSKNVASGQHEHVHVWLRRRDVSSSFVVDDAIVAIENIDRHVEDGAPPMRAATVGSRGFVLTVLSFSLSLIAVFIPLLLMGGTIVRLFREFALPVTASFAVSAIVSLTLVPMMCSRFLRRHTDEHGASIAPSK